MPKSTPLRGTAGPARKQVDPPRRRRSGRNTRTRVRILDAERDFLRKANIGGEAMSEADQQRVRDIGSRRKWRNVDGVETEFLTADEIDNLTIRAGTLTLKERDVINHHIVATIKMLEQLPWPRHLTTGAGIRRRPPRAHGRQGLPEGPDPRADVLQARMMGIADIFEALTARDRPYKPGMKLSQAMGIMANFKKNGHIDPTCSTSSSARASIGATPSSFSIRGRSMRWMSHC
jgi:hypothetical protein